MISKAQVVGIYKRNITHKTLKNKKHFSIRKMSYIAMSLLMFLVLGIGIIDGEYKDILSQVMYPITSLYSDQNDLQFTWSDSVLVEGELAFQMPMLSSDIKVVDGNLIIKSETNAIVKSIEAGVVLEVSSDLYEVRYVKVQHTSSIFSIIENIDIVSVKEGDTVTKNTILGTSKINENVIVSIYENLQKIKSITPNKNMILVTKDNV